MTLHSRRSRLPFGTTITAETVDELRSSLAKKSAAADSNAGHSVRLRPSFQQSSHSARKPKVLGIFTGQSAQSTRMGAALIEQSDYCRMVIRKLELRLAQLPPAHHCTTPFRNF